MTHEAGTDPGAASVPRRVLHARVRNFRGKTLLAVGGDAFELSDTAAFIWKSIDGRKTVAQISRMLTAEYEIDEATALSDTAELLGELARAGLLEFSGGT
jgi:Coenzyme PQQ synthesis protein D (PqqD)